MYRKDRFNMIFENYSHQRMYRRYDDFDVVTKELFDIFFDDSKHKQEEIITESNENLNDFLNEFMIKE